MKEKFVHNFYGAATVIDIADSFTCVETFTTSSEHNVLYSNMSDHRYEVCVGRN